MINYDLLLFFGLWILIFIYINTHKSKFEIQGKIFALRRTKFGLRAMDKWSARWPKTLRFLGYLGIFLGFIGMVVTVYSVVLFALKLLIIPGSAPGLSPVIPGVRIPGIPFVLSFFHFLITIFIVAIVHEFGHGVISRLWDIKVKSSGFAFLGPIPAAFVEPDEESLKAAKPKAALSVYGAGPLANFLLFIPTFLIFVLLLTPMTSSYLADDGIIVGDLPADHPLYGQVKVGEKIMSVNGVEILTAGDFAYLVDRSVVPGDEITLVSESGEYTMVAYGQVADETKSFFPFLYGQTKNLKPDWQVTTFLWIKKLFFWLFMINLGVGMFNLLPLGPLDGGRMFHAAALKFTSEKKANKALKQITTVMILLLLINLSPFIIGLFKWIFGFFV